MSFHNPNICQRARTGRINALKHLSTLSDNRRARTPSVRAAFLTRVARTV